MMFASNRPSHANRCFGRLPIALVALLLVSPGQVASATNASIRLGGVPLERCGTGALTAYRIFSVGEATLYRPQCERPWALPLDEAASILFRYSRAIPASAFAEAAETMLARNIADSQLRTQIATRLEQFHAAYVGVDDGDVYQISYQPDAGLSLWLNQQPLAVLEDGPMARLYFAIWLGNDPFDEDLKHDLLGQ